MEPIYVQVSIPAHADGEVIAAFASVDVIWQFAFCLPSEGQLMPITALNSKGTFCVVWLYAGRSAAHLVGSQWQVTSGSLSPAWSTGIQWYAEVNLPNGETTTWGICVINNP